jgi:hypothetical protein
MVSKLVGEKLQANLLRVFTHTGNSCSLCGRFPLMMREKPSSSKMDSISTFINLYRILGQSTQRDDNHIIDKTQMLDSDSLRI